MAERRGKNRPAKYMSGNPSKAKPPAIMKNLAEQGTSTQHTADAENESSIQQQQESFDRELLWCIEQLERGITANTRADQKKAQEATKVLRILQNPKTPLIKKRQAMRNTFGDYRKKMEEQLKKSNSAFKKMKLDTAAGDIQHKSTFYKKAKLSGADSGSGVEIDFQQLDLGSNSNFKFNFSQSDDPSTQDCLNGKSLVDAVQSAVVPSPCSETNTNYFKMETGASSTDFKFNFDFSSGS